MSQIKYYFNSQYCEFNSEAGANLAEMFMNEYDDITRADITNHIRDTYSVDELAEDLSFIPEDFHEASEMIAAFEQLIDLICKYVSNYQDEIRRHPPE